MYKYIMLSMTIQSMQDSCVIAIPFGMGWDELPFHLSFLSASEFIIWGSSYHLPILTQQIWTL